MFAAIKKLFGLNTAREEYNLLDPHCWPRSEPPPMPCPASKDSPLAASRKPRIRYNADGRLTIRGAIILAKLRHGWGGGTELQDWQVCIVMDTAFRLREQSRQ